MRRPLITGPPASGRRWFRPRLEALEDRAVPGDLLVSGALALPEFEMDLGDKDRAPTQRSPLLAGEVDALGSPAKGPSAGSAAGAAPSSPAPPAPRGVPAAGGASEAALLQALTSTSPGGAQLRRGPRGDGGGPAASPASPLPGGHRPPSLRDPDPLPIRGGDPALNSFGPLFGGPSTEVPHFYLRGPGVELSTITDFNGFIGVAVIDGVGTGTDLTTGQSRELLYEVDIGFMQGVYRAEDGHFYHGTFAFL